MHRLSVSLFLVLQICSSELSCKPPLTAGLYACRGRGLREVPLPIGAPTSRRLAISTLDVTDNVIEILHEGALKPYSSLICLKVERNLLWKITDKAFHAVPQLERLQLRGNRLVIQPGSFSPKSLLELRNLKHLDLSENPVGVIPANFFVPSLTSIHLEQTIWSIVFVKRAFSNLPMLRVLNLANNTFESLPSHLQKEWAELENLKTLQLHGNDWHCDCNIAWLVGIARRLRENPRCSHPPILAGRILTDLPLEEFQCAPVALKKTSSPQDHPNEAEPGSTVLLTCTFHAEPRADITWFRGTEVLPHSMTREAVVGHSLVQTNITLENVLDGQDDGLYRCEAVNARGVDSIKFPLKVGYSLLAKGHDRMSPVTFALILCGGGFLLCLSLTSVVLYCCQKDRARRRVGVAIDRAPMKSETVMVQEPTFTRQVYSADEPLQADIVYTHSWQLGSPTTTYYNVQQHTT